MENINVKNGAVIDDKMLERAMRQLIKILEAEYDCLLRNDMKQLEGMQNHKIGILKFLDAQSNVLNTLLEGGQLLRDIPQARCLELRDVALVLAEHIKKVRSFLLSKTYVNKKMVQAIHDVMLRNSEKSANYRAKGSHVIAKKDLGHLVMSENI